MPKRKVTAVTQQRRGADPEQQFLLEKQQLLLRVGAIQGLLGLFDRQDPQDPESRSLLWLPDASYYEVGLQDFYPDQLLARTETFFEELATAAEALHFESGDYTKLDVMHSKFSRAFDASRGFAKVRPRRVQPLPLLILCLAQLMKPYGSFRLCQTYTIADTEPGTVAYFDHLIRRDAGYRQGMSWQRLCTKIAHDVGRASCSAACHVRLLQTYLPGLTTAERGFTGRRHVVVYFENRLCRG